MKLFIAFVVFKLLVDDVILALVIYVQRKQSKINQQTIELSMRNQTEIESINTKRRLEKLYREKKECMTLATTADTTGKSMERQS